MTFTAKAALVDDPLLAADWHPVRNDHLDPVGGRGAHVSGRVVAVRNVRH